jgi:hypothetical protein
MKMKDAENAEHDRRTQAQHEWEEGQNQKKHEHERELAEQKLRDKLESETRHNKREDENEKIKNEVNQKNKIEEEKRSFIAKSFADPTEAIEFMKNPTNYEGKLESVDPRGVFSRALGMLHGTPLVQKNKLRIKQ